MRFLALMLSVGLLAGCAAKPPSLTPIAQLDYQATQVIQVLDLLRDVAIAGEAQKPPVYTTEGTRYVVQFHKIAISVIHALPAGWKPAVVSGFSTLTTTLSPADLKGLAPYLTIVQTLLNGVV